MTPQDIFMNGRHGTVVYLDSQWHLIDRDHAVIAKVYFDDGTIRIYHVNALDKEGHA